MDITRGSLDGITRSARTHQRQRPDSRVSLQSGSPAFRLETESQGSLEILPPEPGFDYQESDLALEEYLSSGDEDVTTSRCTDTVQEDAIHQLERLILSRNSSRQFDSPNTIEEDQPTGTTKGTQAHGPEPQKHQQDITEDADLKDIEDPKLRKAIQKMRKLDKILSEKINHEKEVKRERLMMHKQYQEELERIKLGLDRREPKEEEENTMKFLALVPPQAHTEGIDNEDYTTSPLFPTQPLDGERTFQDPRKSDRLSPGSEISGSSRQTKDTSSGKETARSKGGRRRKLKPDGGQGSRDEDDFIQRNIQLASDAGNTIAMTDDEKKRLGELLQDVEMLGEESDINQEICGFELQVVPGIGYQPDRADVEALKNLDNKLKGLMPADSFQEICSTPSFGNHSRSGQVGYSQEAFILGERVIKNSKETRVQQDRLKQIEEELVLLQTQVENEISSPSLTKDELDDLFRQCDDVDTRTQSALSSPRTPRPNLNSWNNDDSPSSNIPGNRGPHFSETSGSETSRSEKLSEDTLRKLLEDAKQGLGFEELPIETDIPEGIDFGEDRCGKGLQTCNSVEEDRYQGSRVSQMSNARVPLISHDIIQRLLRNPRATLEEAQTPPLIGTQDISRDDQNMIIL